MHEIPQQIGQQAHHSKTLRDRLTGLHQEAADFRRRRREACGRLQAAREKLKSLEVRAVLDGKPASQREVNALLRAIDVDSAEESTLFRAEQVRSEAINRLDRELDASEVALEELRGRTPALARELLAVAEKDLLAALSRCVVLKARAQGAPVASLDPLTLIALVKSKHAGGYRNALGAAITKVDEELGL